MRKTSVLCHLSFAKHQPERSGMALVIVLGMLVLVLILVIAFFSSVSVDLQSAKRYSSGTAAKTLADSAVSLVISQIQDATAAPNLAWASQPGMIRTYDDQGAPATAFKLYSSNQLRVDGGFGTVLQAAEVPGDWAGSTTLFTDLNKPVAVAGVNHYPILDPAAVAKDVSGGTAVVSGASPIEGCFLDTGNAATATSTTQTNPVPMPVQWMYVLESGKLAGTDPATQKISGASPDDQIVGRIAFWTDDETAKLNINTASEGTFWDRPWARTAFENTLNTSMPVQNEFQRYPGHPAMTSLSPVFPVLAGESIKEYNERIYGIIPRIVGGGSESGTKLNAGAQYTTAYTTPDADRLFSSVDEFLFQAAGRQVNLKGPSQDFTEQDIEKTRFFLTANSRAPEVNLFNKPRISLWPLQIDPDPVDNSKTRTAQDKLIAFCSTIGTKPYYFQRYNTYSFEENRRPAGVDNWANKQTTMPSSQSPTMDWSPLIPRNEQIFKYLQSLTSKSIPGLGGNLAAKYPTSKDQILIEMLDYIRSSVNPQRTLDNTVTAKPNEIEYFYAPGYKRSSPAYFNVIGQQQVAPLIVKDGTSTIGKGFGRFPSVKQAVLIFQASDPTEFKTKTNGTVVDTAAMNQAPLKMRAVLLLDPFHVTPGYPIFCPNVRYKVRWVDANGLPQPCLVNGVALDFPDPAISLITARDTERNLTALGGIEYSYKYYEKPTSNDADHSDLPKRMGRPVVGSADEEQFYPFYSSQISVPGAPAGTPTFQFTGGELEIEIYPGYSQNLDPADCVQTIRMAFPKNIQDVNGVPTNAPIVLPRPSFTSTRLADLTYVAHRYTDFDERLKQPGLEPGYGHNLKPLIISTDTVRSIEALPTGPARGDLRAYAALREVPSSYFGVAGAYGNSATARVHGLRIYPYNLNGNASTLYNGMVEARLGKLVAAVNYYNSPGDSETFHNPIVPNDMVAATMSNGLPGDWDTGPGSHVDGPFINKADMGNNGRFTSYFNLGNNAQTFMPNETGATYSPSRQIASAVAFGSLPTKINPNDPTDIEPWRTLLFGKNPAAGSGHPGFGIPASGPPFTTAPDHAFLDLFTMPIVEPYAISEPFSTAGKVNMNYQMMPFIYLTRDTALRGVLKSSMVMAIPTGDGATYKLTNTTDYRYTINPDEKSGTLKGFENRFTTGDIFRSASEVCDISLVPQYRANTTTPAPGTPTYDAMETWWSSYQLTGDNVREGPYGHIYPRLTTKSNTFTVHVQAQSIAKSRNTPADEFVEGKDQITGEFRGSFLIERYLDPNADSLVKADGKTAAGELDDDAMVGPYKFRVVSTKKFAP